MAAARTCSISGCDKAHFGRSWCAAHYYRWHKHGDPLGGRTANGEPIRFFRDVLMAYEGDECLAWPFAKDQDGYGRSYLDGKPFIVSRRVCEEANGPPPTSRHQAAHSCGNGHLACCTKGHLSWKTPKQNQADRLAHGTHTRGEKQSASKLTEADVREIRSFSGTASGAAIARKFSVDPRTVQRILSGERWGWLHG